jgi:hypothetical protein
LEINQSYLYNPRGAQYESTSPGTPKLRVKQLIEDYRSGRIVIPEFQRDYVWKKSRAPLLIDSLYRGFPISSLLLWQSEEEVRARRCEELNIRMLRLQPTLNSVLKLTSVLLRVHGSHNPLR